MVVRGRAIHREEESEKDEEKDEKGWRGIERKKITDGEERS